MLWFRPTDGRLAARMRSRGVRHLWRRRARRAKCDTRRVTDDADGLIAQLKERQIEQTTESFHKVAFFSDGSGFLDPIKSGGSGA